MTIKTKFDYIIGCPEDQEHTPHLVDAEENVGLIGFDHEDDSTVSSYSDDDSSIGSLDSESEEHVELAEGEFEVVKGKNNVADFSFEAPK